MNEAIGPVWHGCREPRSLGNVNLDESVPVATATLLWGLHLPLCNISNLKEENKLNVILLIK